MGTLAMRTSVFGDKWDKRFLELSRMVSTWSKDPSTKCGAVIVRPDKSICSTGYNGFPMGLEDNEEILHNREAKYSRIIHAEINSLLFAREPIKGYVLYTYPFSPCDRCIVQCIQAGIARVVFPPIPEDKKERWQDSMQKTKQYCTECGVVCDEVGFE